MGEIRSVHVRISGCVQGVNFRAWTARQARELNLSGWVRNIASGDVEAVFTGSAEDIDAMLAVCWEGPRHASVDKVETLGPAEPARGPFEVRGDGGWL